MQKKQPVRMCSGCAAHRPKRELVRVVRTPEGTILLDPGGKKSGRGADAACLKKARKARRLERALDCAIPDEVYARLEHELGETPHE